MIAYFIRNLLNIFDIFQQRKILNFFKNEIKKPIIFFDIGSHHGETVKLFEKKLSIVFFHCFEPSSKNFKILEKNLKKKKYFHICKLNNFALGNKAGETFINFTRETSSSSLNNFNFDSKYMRRKMKILNIKNSEDYYIKEKISEITLSEYIKKNKIEKIDILKIDTEGYELKVLIGAIKDLHKIKFIYFEHHYDDMINKNYKFKDINKILIDNNFKKVFKSKMVFRKSFEYIYSNLLN